MGSARHPLSVVLTSERFHTAYMLTSKPAATKVPRYFLAGEGGGALPAAGPTKNKEISVGPWFHTVYIKNRGLQDGNRFPDCSVQNLTVS